MLTWIKRYVKALLLPVVKPLLLRIRHIIREELDAQNANCRTAISEMLLHLCSLDELKTGQKNLTDKLQVIREELDAQNANCRTAISEMLLHLCSLDELKTGQKNLTDKLQATELLSSARQNALALQILRMDRKEGRKEGTPTLRSFGRSGIMASVVGLGTWHANWTGPNSPIADESTFIRTVHAALDAGINYIDTAPGYVNSEDLVGKALQGKREHVVLVTKCGVVWSNNPYLHLATDRGDGTMICLAPGSIRFEVEQSLRRLKTDYIDLYLTHVQDPKTPVEETMSMMESLRKEGKIRAIGCCDASVADMDRYRSVGCLDVIQRGYNMLYRNAEKTVFPYAIENGMSFVAYQSLAQGLLAASFGPEHVFAPSDWRLSHPFFTLECRRHIQAFLESVRPVAQDHHLTVGQLVIAWTVAQPGCTHTPVSALDERQALENAVAARIALSETDMADIQAAMERYLKDHMLS